MVATKETENIERYCTVEESLIQSFKEVKLMEAGLLPKKSWEEYYKEWQELAERVKNGDGSQRRRAV